MIFRTQNSKSRYINRLIVFVKAWLILCIVGCVGSDGPSNDKVANALFVDPANMDFSENPKLLERILSGPHGYFRFINIIFSNEVCHRFSDALKGTPSFNLHGDAHIEQYAVTDLGRGLTDFDDSSTGPAVLDLMRFGVSLHLACRAHGWSKTSEKLFDRFILGYRTALKEPGTEAPEPTLVKRLRSRFKFDREKYFEWINSIMEPMSQEERDELTLAMKPYSEAMLTENSALAKNFFQIENMGYLRMGIGSALDIKYLVRVRGESSDPEDDVVLEVKEVRDLSGIECITISQKADPFRVLVGQARIAYEPYKFLGYIRFRNHTFWVHSWVDNYKELEIGESLQSIEELTEVAYDVGVQLGRGHTNQIAAPLDEQLRREQLRFLTKNQSNIKAICRELTEQTVAAWEMFRSHAEQEQ